MTAPKPGAKRGRPRKAAAPRPTGPQQPQPIQPDPLTTPADDRAAQSVADRLADVVADAATPGRSASGGRPTSRETAMNDLANQLAVTYTAFGGTVKLLALPLTLVPSWSAIATRLVDLGDELEENAIKCGNALARWADTNKQVRDFLTGASGHAGMLMVLAVHLPIIGAAVGRRDAGRIAGAAMSDIAGADPAADAGIADAMNLASMFANIFTGAAGATDAQRPQVVDTTATEVEQNPANVAA